MRQGASSVRCQMSVVSGSWVAHSARAAGEHVTQVVRQQLDVILLHVVVIPQASVLCRTRGSLKM